MTIALTAAEAGEVRQILRNGLSPAAAGNPEVWVFGSRATGRARPYSDLDLLITRPEKLDWRVRAALTDAFEASRLPFRVDVVEAACLSEGFAARVMAECQRFEIGDQKLV
jgi:uncharacterized protein